MSNQGELGFNGHSQNLEELLQASRGLNPQNNLLPQTWTAEDQQRLEDTLAHFGAVGIQRKVRVSFNINRHDLIGILKLENINYPIHWSQPLPLILSINGQRFSTNDISSINLEDDS